MTIFNTYLGKYVSSTNSTITKHTGNAENALQMSKRDAKETCEALNFTTRTDHYTVRD
mgnify:CR=1 FL=1